MVKIGIEKQGDRGGKAQKRIAVLAGLENKIIARADEKGTVKRAHRRTAQHRRIAPGGMKNFCQQRGDGAFAVTAGHTDASGIIRHEVTQKICPRDTGNAQPSGGGIFGVAGGEGQRVDQRVRAGDMRGVMADKDPRPMPPESRCCFAFHTVRTVHPEAAAKTELGQRGHMNTADAAKKDFFGAGKCGRDFGGSVVRVRQRHKRPSFLIGLAFWSGKYSFKGTGLSCFQALATICCEISTLLFTPSFLFSRNTHIPIE